MDYVFAPSESRALDFLRNNHFGLDYRAKIRVAYHQLFGERYREEDVLYVLDGCPPEMLTVLQMNVMSSKRAPATISVEER